MGLGEGGVLGSGTSIAQSFPYNPIYINMTGTGITGSIIDD